MATPWRMAALMLAFLAAPLSAAETVQSSRPWLPADAPRGETVMRKPASYALPPAPGIPHDLKGLV